MHCLSELSTSITSQSMLLQVLMPVGMFILIANCWNCSVIIQTAKASLRLNCTSDIVVAFACVRTSIMYAYSKI